MAPVQREVADAQATYDRLAPYYDLTEAPFERCARAAGLRLLAAQPGEHIAEIGFGTGHSLAGLARQLGPAGTVVGVDLSRRMAEMTRRRFNRAGLGVPLLVQADARSLPVAAAAFDAVTMSFVLELMDTPDIPAVLEECRRALRPDGRLAVVSLDLATKPGSVTRIYLAAHRRWPRLVDCRPLPLAEVLTSAGFTPLKLWSGSILGLKVAGVLAAP